MCQDIFKGTIEILTSLAGQYYRLLVEIGDAEFIAMAEKNDDVLLEREEGISHSWDEEEWQFTPGKCLGRPVPRPDDHTADINPAGRQFFAGQPLKCGRHRTGNKSDRGSN